MYYGLPVFITISPDEKNEGIMFRLMRVRQSDPAWIYDEELRSFAGPNSPKFLEEDIGRGHIPGYEARRAALAQKPQAAALGFRVHLTLLLRAAFGLRVCLRCPTCMSHGGRECQCGDLLGNSSSLEGGAFGRCCAAAWSVENQKQGPLHVHGHVVLECAHQHKSLAELAVLLEQRGRALYTEYINFKSHVCREEYTCPELWTPEKQAECEAAWPEYSTTPVLYTLPKCLGFQHDGSDGHRWLQEYKQFLFQIQCRKQHHIHLPDASGSRKPLPSCLDRAAKDLCKHGYPKTKQMAKQGCVVCPGMAEKLELPLSGRKNALGTLHGPRGDEYLNGTHGVLLALGRANSDVQVPYRLPICGVTHSEDCQAACLQRAETEKGWIAEMARAAQKAQAAQVGYQTDYANKGQGAALHECKEFGKGHQQLAEEKLKGESIGYVTRRHMQRLISDCCARGVVRGAVETENLNMQAADPNVCAAEMITSFPYVAFRGQTFLELVENSANREWSRLQYRVHVSKPIKEDVQAVAFQHTGLFYGFRGNDPRVLYLSPYEWVSQWEVVRKPCRMPGQRRIVDFSSNGALPTVLQCLGLPHGSTLRGEPHASNFTLNKAQSMPSIQSKTSENLNKAKSALAENTGMK